jgi:hypothetical protein
MRHYIFAALLMCLADNIHAMENNSCQVEFRAEDWPTRGSSKAREPAVIFGESVKVAAFRVRFVDAKTGHVLRPDKVTLAYGWKWLQYPYPEHPWGAWSPAVDTVSCTDISGDEIAVPEFEVKPRGWYNGRYAKFPFAGKPSFTGIDITATLAECLPRMSIKPGDARDLRGRTVIVKWGCNGEPTATNQK